MKIGAVVIAAGCLILAVEVLNAQSIPPSPYIDKGACPFEGCVYRAWTAKETVDIFAKPGSRNKVGVVRRGERVTGITGEVHSVPVLVHVEEDIPDLQHPGTVMIPKGKALYLIHYLGEDAWLCWYQGRLTPVDDFPAREPFPKITWWVKIKTSTGLTGWAISKGNFDGQDRFG